MGKTNTPEFGAGANTVNRVYGATVNPFATTLSASGSSGGSAAALATDMIPLASGGDLGGSLRTPASFCGIVGHRPSPGTCPTNRAADGWSPLAVEGGMARDVGDTALLIAAIAGRAPMDPISLDLSPEPFLSLPPVRLRRSQGCLQRGSGIDSDRRGCPRVLSKRGRSNGASVRNDRSGVTRIAATSIRPSRRSGRSVMAIPMVSYVRGHRDVASPNVIANVEIVGTLSVSDIGRAHAAQTNLFRKFQTFFEDVDVLICPAAAVAPFPVDEVYVKEVGGSADGKLHQMDCHQLRHHAQHPPHHGHSRRPRTDRNAVRHSGGGTPSRRCRHLGDRRFHGSRSSPRIRRLARPKPDIGKLSDRGIETRAGQVSPEWIGALANVEQAFEAPRPSDASC